MITIEDAALYQAYRTRNASATRSNRVLNEIVYPVLLFGCIGAITYAIRGTGGWGGFDGGILPGMTGAWMWYYAMRRKGLDSRGMVFWLGIGIATGAMLGYGQYASWVNGTFGPAHADFIEPWMGYAWFFVAGTGFSVGGIFLGWSLDRRRPTAKRWLLRILLPFAFAIACYGLMFMVPNHFFPNLSLCTQPDYKNYCEQMISTNVTNAVFMAWWIGALVVAAIDRDKTTLVCGLIIGIGFGLAQAIGGWIFSLWVHAPGFLDWWKAWELTTGFIGGMAIALALYWVLHDVDKTFNPDGTLVFQSTSMDQATRETSSRIEKQKKTAAITSTLALLALLLVAWHGMTYYLGVDLGLYAESSLDQYAYAPGRIVLLVLGAAAILSGFTWRLARHVARKNAGMKQVLATRDLHRYLLYMVLYLFVIGICTIWEMRIAMLYAVHLAIALVVLDRMAS